VRETERETVYVKNTAALRRWFEKNHASSPSVWLVINKKDSRKPGAITRKLLRKLSVSVG
jgi:hypothetical protein